MRDQVLFICIAYESGFGHGAENRNLGNPYGEGTDEFDAYAYGWEQGRRRSSEAQAHKAVSPTDGEPHMTNLSELAGSRKAVADGLLTIYNEDQANEFLASPQKLLGGAVPMDLIRQGRMDDVERLVSQIADGVYA